MAPFRGGRSFKSSRGGRRGGRNGSGRDGAVSSGRIARSGIKTRSGYKKFDSQRVRDVEPENSDNGIPDGEENSEDLEEDNLSGTDGELDTLSSVKAYNALIQSFSKYEVHKGRSRKRRKVNVEDGGDSADLIDDTNGMIASEAEGEDNDEDEGSDKNESEYDDSVVMNGGSNLAIENDEDGADLSDPYEAHFAVPGEDEVSTRLKALRANEWRTERRFMDDIGGLTVSTPITLRGIGMREPVIKAPADLKLKKKLSDGSKEHLPSFNSLQQTIAPYVFNYMDLLVGCRTAQNGESLRSLACLHALNHVLKGRDRILRNAARLSRADAAEDIDVRDQGFTRPKVLILVETRQMADQYAECLVKMFKPEQQENKQRFKDSFSADIDGGETMPTDYRELFNGNNDNNFLTSIKFTRKTLKFFSAFYTSDVILASPLGLRRIIEHDDVKKRDFDFLSSIEMVIVDQADAMQMQSWENVEIVVKHLNLPLREAHGCDFNRVRHWYLDGNAQYFRQTIVFGAYVTPEMNRLFNTGMLNMAGKARLMPRYEGTIAEIGGLGIKQTFSRFDAVSPASDPDARSKYFTTAVLPSLLRLPKPADGSPGILIFIPSYYDFLRIRNFFATSTLTQNISFGAIDDYSEVSDQRRARSHFLSGRHSILLYTQRAHHFFRLRLKGVKRVVMYGLPDNAIFYQELVGDFLGTSISEGRTSPEESGARVMFSKWDGLRLERVVGSGRVKGMLGGLGDTFNFV